MTEATRRWRVGGAGDSDVNGDGDEMLGRRAGDDKEMLVQRRPRNRATLRVATSRVTSATNQLRESGEALPASRVVDS